MAKDVPARSTDALLIMAKQPVPGQTKTRLSPPLTLEQAAVLYECFLLDTLDLMRQVSNVVRAVAYWPNQAES